MSSYLRKQQIKDKFNHINKLIESRNVTLSKQQKKVLLESIKLSTLINETKFKYIGMDSRGKEVSGVIEADSQNAVINRLKEKGYFPTKVLPAQTFTVAVKDKDGKESEIRVTAWNADDAKKVAEEQGYTVNNDRSVVSGGADTSGGGEKIPYKGSFFKDRQKKSGGTTSGLSAFAKGVAGLIPGVGRSVSTGYTKSGQYGPERIKFSDLTNKDYVKAVASQKLGTGTTFKGFQDAVYASFKQELSEDIRGLINDLSDSSGTERLEKLKKAFDDKDSGIANKIVKFIVFYRPEAVTSQSLRKKILAHLNKPQKKDEPAKPDSTGEPTPPTPPATDETPVTPDPATTPDPVATTEPPVSTPPSVKVTSVPSGTPPVTERLNEAEGDEAASEKSAEGGTASGGKASDKNIQIYEDMLDFLQKYIPKEVINLKNLLGGALKFDDIDTAISQNKRLEKIGDLNPKTGKTDSKQFNYIIDLLNNEEFLKNFKDFVIQSIKEDNTISYKTSKNCGCLFVKKDEASFSYVLKHSDNKISNGIDNIQSLKSSFKVSATESNEILSEAVKSETNSYLEDLVDQIAFLFAHGKNNLKTVNPAYNKDNKINDVNTLFELISLYIPKCEHYDTIKFVAENHVTVLDSAITNKFKALGMEVSYPTAFVVNQNKGIVEILKQKAGSAEELTKIFNKLSRGIHFVDEDSIMAKITAKTISIDSETVKRYKEETKRHQKEVMNACLDKMKDIIKEVNPAITINTYDDVKNVNDDEFKDDSKLLKILNRYKSDYEKVYTGQYSQLSKFKIEDNQLIFIFINNELKTEGLYPPFYIK